MPNVAANLSFMFTEVDFLDRFEAAAIAGFRAVEFHFPYAHDAAELAGRIRGLDLTTVLHNLPPGDWEAGERGIACHPDRVEEFREGIVLGAEYARALDCRQVNCLSGIRPDGVEEEVLRRTMVENLRFGAAHLATHGVSLLVEPINSRDVPGFYLGTSAQARSLIAEVGSDNLKIQYDVYHMQIMEGDLAPTVKENLDLIAHMQLADTPGRNEPGTGEINYDYLLPYLDEIGYGGWVGCEYHPVDDTVGGLGWADKWLK